MKLTLTGHREGHTEVIFDKNNNPITCGADGTIKLWKSISFDTAPETINCGETVNSIAINNETLYASCNNNRVRKYSTVSRDCEGLLFQFDGNPTYVHVSESLKVVAAGANNFEVRVFLIDCEDVKFFKGHKAPVLSVAVDPLDKYVASVGCDGDLKIWDIKKNICVKSIKVIPPTNDIINSKSLARISWQPVTGDDIAVPCESEIKLYTRDNWTLSYSYKCEKSTKEFNGCLYSPCMRYLAGYTTDGWVCVWDTDTHQCLKTLQHPRQSCITSVAWDGDSSILALTDINGEMAIIDDLFPTSGNKFKDSYRDDLDALFENEDGDMNDFMDAEAAEIKKDDEDELPSLTKKKNIGLFEDSDDEKQDNPSSQTSDFAIPSTNAVNTDNNSLEPPLLPPTEEDADLLLDDATSITSRTSDRKASLPKNFPSPTPMQKAFQPSATPEHLAHRFMLWNSIGVIRSYADEIENAIDVEFHDVSLHHTIHVRNEAQTGGALYTMADLSANALVLASAAADDTQSKLTCNHFSSWGTNKEWSIEMNEGEDIKCVTVGDSWVAACTDQRIVRMFTFGGMQRHIFSIPGPVVALAAHTDQLLIVYHISQGFNSNQNLGVMLLDVDMSIGGNPACIINGSPLPLSKKSELRWVGFTAEGSPVYMDSAGMVRMLNRSFANTWIPVIDTRKSLKSRHDNYWIVGVHENPQQLRCILCKGSLFPQTLPRPLPTILPFNIPFCESETEKTKFEGDYWRENTFSSHLRYLDSQGYDTDESFKKNVALEMQQTLMKMFALSCKTDRDYRATEICRLMTSASAVNLAIKYAARLRKLALANKLGEIAQEKGQREIEMAKKEQRRQMMHEEYEEEEDGDDFKKELQAGYSKTETEWSSHSSRSALHTQSTNTNTQQDDDLQSQPSLHLTPESSQQSTFSQHAIPSSATSVVNPFKRTPVNLKRKSTSVLDNITRTASAVKLRGVISSKDKKEKKIEKDTLKQKTIFDTNPNFSRTSTPKTKKTISRIDADSGDTGSFVRPGVQVYIEEKLDDFTQANPDLDSMDVRKKIIAEFRALTPDQKKEWANKGKSGSTSTKRKHEDNGVDENLPEIELTDSLPNSKLRRTEDEPAAKRPLNEANNKLQSFAYDD